MLNKINQFLVHFFFNYTTPMTQWSLKSLPNFRIIHALTETWTWSTAVDKTQVQRRMNLSEIRGMKVVAKQEYEHLWVGKKCSCEVLKSFLFKCCEEYKVTRLFQTLICLSVSFKRLFFSSWCFIASNVFSIIS